MCEMKDLFIHDTAGAKTEVFSSDSKDHTFRKRQMVDSELLPSVVKKMQYITNCCKTDTESCASKIGDFKNQNVIIINYDGDKLKEIEVELLCKPESFCNNISEKSRIIDSGGLASIVKKENPDFSFDEKKIKKEALTDTGFVPFLKKEQTDSPTKNFEKNVDSKLNMNQNQLCESKNYMNSSYCNEIGRIIQNVKNETVDDYRKDLHENNMTKTSNTDQIDNNYIMSLKKDKKLDPTKLFLDCQSSSPAVRRKPQIKVLCEDESHKKEIIDSFNEGQNSVGFLSETNRNISSEGERGLNDDPYLNDIFQKNNQLKTNAFISGNNPHINHNNYYINQLNGNIFDNSSDSGNVGNCNVGNCNVGNCNVGNCNLGNCNFNNNAFFDHNFLHEQHFMDASNNFGVNHPCNFVDSINYSSNAFNHNGLYINDCSYNSHSYYPFQMRNKNNNISNLNFPNSEQDEFSDNIDLVIPNISANHFPNHQENSNNEHYYFDIPSQNNLYKPDYCLDSNQSNEPISMTNTSTFDPNQNNIDCNLNSVYFASDNQLLRMIIDTENNSNNEANFNLNRPTGSSNSSGVSYCFEPAVSNHIYKHGQHEWRATYCLLSENTTTKRPQKTFSCRKYGEQGALERALGVHRYINHFGHVPPSFEDSVILNIAPCCSNNCYPQCEKGHVPYCKGCVRIPNSSRKSFRSTARSH